MGVISKKKKTIKKKPVISDEQKDLHIRKVLEEQKKETQKDIELKKYFLTDIDNLIARINLELKINPKEEKPITKALLNKRKKLHKYDYANNKYTDKEMLEVLEAHKKDLNIDIYNCTMFIKSIDNLLENNSTLKKKAQPQV